jgi:hypothetical protein
MLLQARVLLDREMTLPLLLLLLLFRLQIFILLSVDVEHIAFRNT